MKTKMRSLLGMFLVLVSVLNPLSVLAVELPADFYIEQNGRTRPQMQQKMKELSESTKKELENVLYNNTPYTTNTDSLSYIGEELGWLENNWMTSTNDYGWGKGVESRDFDISGVTFRIGPVAEINPNIYGEITDIRGVPLASQIKKFGERGFSRGVDSNFNATKFFPNNKVNTANAFWSLDILFLSKTAHQRMKQTRTTIDALGIPTETWYYMTTSSIASRLNMETIEATLLTDNKAAKFLTKEELAQVIYELTNSKLKQDPAKLKVIKDIKAIKYIDAVNYCIKAGLMQVDSKGNFNPNYTITNAQFADIIVKLDDQVPQIDPYKTW